MRESERERERERERESKENLNKVRGQMYISVKHFVYSNNPFNIVFLLTRKTINYKSQYKT